MNLIVKDPFQRKIEIANWIVLAFLFIPALIFAPLKFAAGVLLGGFISIINFQWLARSLRGMFKNPAGNVKGPALAKYYIRLTLTAIVLFCLIAGDVVNVFGLLIGLSVVVINIVATMITSLTKKNYLRRLFRVCTLCFFWKTIMSPPMLCIPGLSSRCWQLYRFWPHGG